MVYAIVATVLNPYDIQLNVHKEIKVCDKRTVFPLAPFIYKEESQRYNFNKYIWKYCVYFNHEKSSALYIKIIIIRQWKAIA